MYKNQECTNWDYFFQIYKNHLIRYFLLETSPTMRWRVVNCRYCYLRTYFNGHHFCWNHSLLSTRTVLTSFKKVKHYTPPPPSPMMFWSTAIGSTIGSLTRSESSLWIIGNVYKESSKFTGVLDNLIQPYIVASQNATWSFPSIIGANVAYNIE